MQKSAVIHLGWCGKQNLGATLTLPGLYRNSISFQGPDLEWAPSMTISGRPPTPVIRRNSPYEPIKLNWSTLDFKNSENYKWRFLQTYFNGLEANQSAILGIEV